ncbi:hypothetical protein [Actinophytocola sp.]|jgi:hypothetical protein|uniref:hypothetical protein n=1 Tax=Actinophytocola sp. TaxID=1872138 RepID=UPI00389AA295
MTPDDVERTLATARTRGYRFRTRHQPAAEHELPDWVVVVTTPDGRVLFPDAVDDDENAARARAADRVARDMAKAPNHG